MSKSIALVLVMLLLVELGSLFVEPTASSQVAGENTWVQKAPMQQARSHMGVAVVNDKIYAIGGTNMTGYNYGNSTDSTIVNTNEVYNPATDTWTSKAPMPRAMYGFAITTYQNKIYCMGQGVNQVYDTVTDTWESKSPMPTERAGLQAHTIDNEIYLVGGKNASLAATNANEVYDPQMDTWSTKKPSPIAVDYCASAVVNDKLFIFGGDSSINRTLGYITQIYDAKKDSWSIGSTSPFITTFAQTGVILDEKGLPKIYLIDAGLLDYSSDQLYDQASDSWATSVTQPTRRMAFSVAVVNNVMYAIGGVNYSSSPFDWYNPRTLVTQFALCEQYTPFGYGTVAPSPTSANQAIDTQTTATPQPATSEPLPTIPIAATATAAIIAGVWVSFYCIKRRSLHPA